MRVVIITGGKITDYEYIKKQIRDDDTIICADSGYDHAIKMNLSIDLLVGDFDSISSIPEDIKKIEYPEKKDFTDTELAIYHARKLGFKDFLIIAGTGNRMDHTLTNIFILKDFLENNEYAEIIDEHNKIILINSEIELYESKGSIISLIPLEDCLGVTADNLEYPLNEDTLKFGKGLGVSNIMLEDTVHISVKQGILLIIIAKD